jgi:S-adenosyl methyltransferase
VLAHARALLARSPEGATAYIDAGARDPENILRQAAALLDFGKPVAVMMLAVLHFIPDSGGPQRIVSRLPDAVCSGSYLTISEDTRDVDTARLTGAIAGYNEGRVAAPVTLRTRAQIARYFDGLDLVEPGLVPVQEWRAPADPAKPLSAYVGIGRKP